jgi:hypothetical protein
MGIYYARGGGRNEKYITKFWSKNSKKERTFILFCLHVLRNIMPLAASKSPSHSVLGPPLIPYSVAV